jgi:hypothetical protein
MCLEREIDEGGRRKLETLRHTDRCGSTPAGTQPQFVVIDQALSVSEVNKNRRKSYKSIY